MVGAAAGEPQIPCTALVRQVLPRRRTGASRFAPHAFLFMSNPPLSGTRSLEIPCGNRTLQGWLLRLPLSAANRQKRPSLTI